MKSFPDKRYDLIFIDGLHLEHQSDKDIVNALRHLNPGGAVVVHDCLPPDEPSQSEIDPAGSWSGTVWRSVIKCSLQTKLDITIVDTDWGVGIIEYTDQPIFQPSGNP